MAFCQPEEGVIRDFMNLGEFLEGDRIENSPYILRMKEDMFCQQLCVSNLGRDDNKLVSAIRANYQHNWMVDKLPAVSKSEDDYTITTRYWEGFPIGFIDEDSGLAYVHNHVNIEIMYHPVMEYDRQKYQIVRFTVEPFSIKHYFGPTDRSDYVDIVNPIESCRIESRSHTTYDMVTNVGREPQPASGRFLSTYDVTWIQNDDVDWASRWQIYLTMDNSVPAGVHLFPIIIGFVCILALAGIITCLAASEQRRAALACSYQIIATSGDQHLAEEQGLKAIAAEVFRPPSFSPIFLCAACGTGAQLVCTAAFVLLFSIFGKLSEANRGFILANTIIVYALMGFVSGYFSALLDTTFESNGGKRLLFLTAFGFPGLWFSALIGNNIVASIHHSTDAVDLGTISLLLFLWFVVAVPLVVWGDRCGRKRQEIQYPVEASRYLPRSIPSQPCFLRVPVVIILGGILPAGVIFPEFYYIQYSIWRGYYYDDFGHLLIASLESIIISLETMLLTHYLSLKRENHRWWWRSFVTASAPVLYLSLWSFFVEGSKIATGSFSAFFKYYTYSALLLFGLVLVYGCTGIACCLCFNKWLYHSFRFGVETEDARIELLPRGDS
eukprot:scaffold2783_cov129-Cylindrotheca_fusiformis.AAC.9